MTSIFEIVVTRSWRRYEWIASFPAILQNSGHSFGNLDKSSQINLWNGIGAVIVAIFAKETFFYGTPFPTEHCSPMTMGLKHCSTELSTVADINI